MVAPPVPIVAGPERDPHDLMIAYFQSGNYPRALEECKKALDKHPENAATYGNCGAVYYKLNRLPEALEMLTQSVRISESTGKQGSAFVFNTLGSVYMDQGDNKGALAAFERATIVDPKFALAFYNMGLIYKKTRSLNQAKDSFRKVTQLTPLNKDAHFNLALVYDEQGETGNALASFRTFRGLAVGLPDYKSDVELADERIKDLAGKIPKPD